MENGWSWEQKTLINELVQGMDLAKQLRVQLSTTSSTETKELLIQRILASYDKALSILGLSGGSVVQHQNIRATSGVPEPAMSVDESPRTDYFIEKENEDNKCVSKKRKALPKWTEQVRVNSESGLEGPQEDGYNWRKYGQKDILGAKYPRSYYRCTYRTTQNCWATKQVQRSDDDSALFQVTYRGTHTCSYVNQSVPPPASSEEQEQKINHSSNNNNQHQQPQPEQVLLHFRKSLRVNTEELNSKETASTFSFPSTLFGCMNGDNYSFSPLMLDNNNSMGSFSPSYISPETPESHYFSPLPYHMNNSGGIHPPYNSESDIAEMISANTSATNSPILDLDFPLESVEMDPNFPFDIPGLFK
ncbi:WRKY domain-containing protein [Cephalotus follicularis]|uniref:WRKY domain-containing protein n=1 Tax=Cephalotus follicularis TaxID=3775 RepID=A0A1Q3BCV0_CEPFO|nr:WRKY domain-containing protein [Cephalotus follicularis]